MSKKEIEVGTVIESFVLATRNDEGGYDLCYDLEGVTLRANTLSEVRELKDIALDSFEPPIFVIRETSEVIEEI